MSSDNMRRMQQQQQQQQQQNLARYYANLSAQQAQQTPRLWLLVVRCYAFLRNANTALRGAKRSQTDEDTSRAALSFTAIGARGRTGDVIY
jgi:hypothetical protein